MPRDPQSASEVYSSLLLLQKLGYPLWFPGLSENLPKAYRAQGVSIGDVGIVTPDGAFDFLFNMCRPRDDPINSNGVPEGFQVPFVLQDADIEKQSHMYSAKTHIAESLNREHKGGGSIMSDVPPAGGGGGIELSFSSNKAAVLALPSGASLWNTLTPEMFRSYAEEQAEAWYRYAAVTRRRSTNALYLVTGCVKCSSWGVASLSSSSRSASVALHFSASSIAEGKLSYKCSWETRSPAHTRTGPATPSKARNQCVFLRGYRITPRNKLKAMILRKRVEVDTFDEIEPDEFRSKSHGRNPWGALSPSKSSSSGQSKSSLGESDSKEGANEAFEVEDIPSSETYHPLSVVNAYLLDKMPKADFAITHDDDWCAVIRETDKGLIDDDELIRRIDESFTVDSSNSKVAKLGAMPERPPTYAPYDSSQPTALKGVSQANLSSEKGPETEILAFQNELDGMEEKLLLYENNDALLLSENLSPDEVHRRQDMASKKKDELKERHDNMRAYLDILEAGPAPSANMRTLKELIPSKASAQVQATGSTSKRVEERKSPVPQAPPVHSQGGKRRHGQEYRALDFEEMEGI